MPAKDQLTGMVCHWFLPLSFVCSRVSRNTLKPALHIQNWYFPCYLENLLIKLCFVKENQTEFLDMDKFGGVEAFFEDSISEKKTSQSKQAQQTPALASFTWVSIKADVRWRKIQSPCHFYPVWFNLLAVTLQVDWHTWLANQLPPSYVWVSTEGDLTLQSQGQQPNIPLFPLQHSSNNCADLLSNLLHQNVRASTFLDVHQAWCTLHRHDISVLSPAILFQ